MKIKPSVLVLKTDGTNCDGETVYAFELVGGEPELVHVNELRSGKEKLRNYQILALPGGFSYGDDIASGKILALELASYLSEEIKSFIKRGGLVIGICNGFQVLVRTGLLPFGKLGKMQTTLTNNDSGHFECRWINLKIEKDNRCVFLNSLNTSDGGIKSHATPPRWPDGLLGGGSSNGIISYQVAHGEGKFFAPPDVLKKIEKENLVVFRYVDWQGRSTQKYPENPNGALNAIAGICDPSGRILGLMPHPERFVRREQHPNWRRIPNLEPQGLPIFKQMVDYVKEV